jgi:hypothetical protein
VVVANARRVVLTCDLCARGGGEASCAARLPLAGGPLELHAYTGRVSAGGDLTAAALDIQLAESLLLEAGVVPPACAAAAAATAAGATAKTANGTGMQVGILYEGWHGFAAAAMTNVSALGGVQLSVEDVLQSTGPGGADYALADILDK